MTYKNMSVVEVMQDRVFEVRTAYYEGDVNIYDMWIDDGKYYISGATERGFVFAREVPADGNVRVIADTGSTP